MTPILWGLTAYVAVQVAIGFLVAPRIKSNDDYILAGRRLGYGLGTFTIFATWFGAETCLGAAGQAYELGLVAAEVDPLGYALCLFLLGVVFAARLWKGKYLTLGDFFRERYSAAMERLAVLLLVPTSILWAGAQLRAFGQVLSESSTLSIETSIVVATVVVLLYTTAGGMMADAVTDLIQGMMLILGLFVLAYSVVGAHGGWSAFDSIPAERLRLFGVPGRPWYAVANAWAVPVLNAVVSQELIARTLASKSPSVARNNCLIAGVLYLTVGAIPFALGLLGPHIVAHLEHPERILTTLAAEHLSTFWFVLFAGAIVSALLSTIDSSLLVSASLVSHNLLGFATRRASEWDKVWWARLWVVLLGLAAYGATFFSESVFDLVHAAGQFGASGLFVVIAFGLFTRFGRAASAGASMIVGVVVHCATSVLDEHSQWFAWIPKVLDEDFPSFLVTLTSAGLAYVAVAALERRWTRRPAGAY